MKKIARKYEKKTKKVLYKVFEMCYCLDKQKKQHVHQFNWQR